MQSGVMHSKQKWM